jgi:hypothetical protein
VHTYKYHYSRPLSSPTTLQTFLIYSNKQTNKQQPLIMNSNNQAGAGKEDYADKGLDAVEKKFGGSMGQNTEKNRGVNEKIVSS